jgi:hypothetical protein
LTGLNKNGDRRRVGQQITHKSQTLSSNLILKDDDACNVAARSIEAGDATLPGRVDAKEATIGILVLAA